MRARPVPALPCGDAAYDAGFHDNVKLFVSEHGVPLRLAPRDAGLLSAWRVALAWPAGAAPSPPPPLYVVEERLDEGDVLVCDQCRIMGALGVGEGWGGVKAPRGQHPEAKTATHDTLPSHPTHTRLATPPRLRGALPLCGAVPRGHRR